MSHEPKGFELKPKYKTINRYPDVQASLLHTEWLHPFLPCALLSPWIPHVHNCSTWVHHNILLCIRLWEKSLGTIPHFSSQLNLRERLPLHPQTPKALLQTASRHFSQIHALNLTTALDACSTSGSLRCMKSGDH